MKKENISRPQATNIGNLQGALRAFKDVGGHVGNFPGTGELHLTHPRMKRPLRLNCRRKDTPRVLIVAIRQLSGNGPVH